MRTQLRVGVGLLTAAALGMAPGFGLAARSTELSSNRSEAPAKVLEIYVRSPVLVRAGERVQLPVQVVCATAHGDPCASTVTLGSREGASGPWRLTSAQAIPSLRFDLSAPASRALGAAPTGTVDFFIRATGRLHDAVQRHLFHCNQLSHDSLRHQRRRRRAGDSPSIRTGPTRIDMDRIQRTI